jgi:YihY family inner membrane protein
MTLGAQNRTGNRKEIGMSPEANNKKAATGKQAQAIKKSIQPMQAFVTKFFNDWGFILAGAIAYNVLMSMVPIATALIAILGLILGDSSIRAGILHQVPTVFPGLARQENALNLASAQLRQSSGILGIFAVILAILFGSLLFIVIEVCLDIMYRVRPRPFLLQFLVAIGMFILFVILIPIMVFVSAGPTILFSLLNSLPFLKNIPGSSLILLSAGSILGGFFSSFILFESIYLIVPNQRISLRSSWCGAAIAALLLEIFLAIYPLILSHFFGTYVGTVGFAFVTLLFFYIFSILLLIGAEINAFFFEGVRPLPNDVTTFVSTIAGRLNKDVPITESRYHQDSTATEQADEAHIVEALRRRERETG